MLFVLSRAGSSQLLPTSLRPFLLTTPRRRRLYINQTGPETTELSGTPNAGEMHCVWPMSPGICVCTRTSQPQKLNTSHDSLTFPLAVLVRFFNWIVCWFGFLLNIPATCYSVSHVLICSILRAATLRKKLQINVSTSSCHSILTPGRPIPGLTIYREAPGRVATGVPIFKSLV